MISLYLEDFFVQSGPRSLTCGRTFVCFASFLHYFFTCLLSSPPYVKLACLRDYICYLIQKKRLFITDDTVTGMGSKCLYLAGNILGFGIDLNSCNTDARPSLNKLNCLLTSYVYYCCGMEAKSPCFRTV